MEAISLKLEKEMLRNIDGSLKRHNFGTRTEFIRGAIRDKLEGLSREELIQKFLKTAGKAKKKTTYEENRRTREQVVREMAKEKGWEL